MSDDSRSSSQKRVSGGKAGAQDGNSAPRQRYFIAMAVRPRHADTCVAVEDRQGAPRVARRRNTETVERPRPQRKYDRPRRRVPDMRGVVGEEQQIDVRPAERLQRDRATVSQRVELPVIWAVQVADEVQPIVRLEGGQRTAEW